MTKAQKEFKKQMKSFEKEKPYYFEYHNTYMQSSRSHRRKILQGGGFLIFLFLFIVLLMYINGVVSPTRGDGTKIMERTVSLANQKPLMVSKTKKTEVIYEINSILNLMEDYVKQPVDLDPLELSKQVQNMELKYTQELQAYMTNYLKVRAELDKTTDSEKFYALRSTIEDYVLDTNLIIKNICETYGIKVNFTKSDKEDEGYMIHYEY